MTQRVLIDTSAIYAPVSASDDFHSQARRAYAKLIDEREYLYITSYILLEASALIHRRLGFPVLERTVNSLRDSSTVFWVDREIHGEAWDLLGERQGGLSLVDCSTIVMAAQLDAKVFAFDEHFRKEDLALSL